jgi:hypothetical protein
VNKHINLDTTVSFDPAGLILALNDQQAYHPIHGGVAIGQQ